MLAAHALRDEVRVRWNLHRKEIPFKHGDEIEFLGLKDPAISLELAITVSLEFLIHRRKRQHMLGHIGEMQGRILLFEVFENLELIAANHLDRRFREIVMLRPQNVPAGAGLIEEIAQAWAQDIRIRLDMDDFIDAQLPGHLHGVEKAAPPAGIVLDTLPPQVIVESND